MKIKHKSGIKEILETKSQPHEWEVNVRREFMEAAWNPVRKQIILQSATEMPGSIIHECEV